jgi:hypothetical protein
MARSKATRMGAAPRGARGCKSVAMGYGEDSGKVKVSPRIRSRPQGRSLRSLQEVGQICLFDSLGQFCVLGAGGEKKETLQN